ncbi:cupin domain-containing protein [Actibacterium sp. MT2.3-13A]|uniref:cupin domain-containing protein n=1 Tax=Actibacterium sp. MT2.3-13A TaxID=2828332 RepID=UPI001BA97C23|nr:cupin domain-containing protein [Actibacterium sp. MT2.3-13A]
MKDLTEETGAVECLGVKYKTILTPEQTAGAMSIVDSWSPAGSGPPRHFHEREDETFVMITGTCKVWIEGEELLAAPGESVFILL